MQVPLLVIQEGVGKIERVEVFVAVRTRLEHRGWLRCRFGTVTTSVIALFLARKQHFLVFCNFRHVTIIRTSQAAASEDAGAGLEGKLDAQQRCLRRSAGDNQR